MLDVKKKGGLLLFFCMWLFSYINNLRYAFDTTLMAESEEELKSLLMKEESDTVCLKLSIQKMKIMASGPITSWQINGETVKTIKLLKIKHRYKPLSSWISQWFLTDDTKTQGTKEKKRQVRFNKT